MNKLPFPKRTQIIQLLVEGTSLRATSRIADVSINTVTKLLVDVGRACQDFHDAMVVNVRSQRVQCDEIWSFVYNIEEAVAALDGAGDVWTWTGIDADTKLIVSWFVGNRDAESAIEFMQDIKSRLATHVQLTTDGHKPYLKAVDATFDGEVNFAQLVKLYGSHNGEGNDKRYSSAEFTRTKKTIIEGRSDEKHISTSFVGRQNLTNGFSKKIENHCYAIALHFVYYNFCKVHKTLRVTPAMEAGLADRPMSIAQIAELTPIEAQKVRGNYKKD